MPKECSLAKCIKIIKINSAVVLMKNDIYVLAGSAEWVNKSDVMG